MAVLEHLASQIAVPLERARSFAEVEEKARIDDLTGLLNRRSLDELMASEISRHFRYGGVFSVIILDLDSFKAFNDKHGHLAGDRLLEKVGAAIKGTIRGADLAFRHGGDEFAILLPATKADAATQVAERVRKQIALQVVDDKGITVSLGLASWPADGKTASEVISAADVALYAAKQGGGNRVQPYQKSV
jgi:diguanylate cyclase (GGDEF)-like protein